MSFEKVPNFLGNLFAAEMNGSEQGRFRFNSFLLDAAERELLRGEEVIPLAPKSFDTLLYLVRNSGHLVTKDELMTAVWPDSFVEEGNLPRTIHVLRKALGEDQNGNKFIKTVPTKGYRFVAHVTELDQREHLRPTTPAANSRGVE
jgi:DNA-binding winged helix-turn-helix (wHTH) protein